MANKYDPKTPVTELSKEFIKDLVLHQTLSSLRRAAGDSVGVRDESNKEVSPGVVVKEGTKKVPTVYYICENPLQMEPDQWTVHALISDVQKFLLLGLTEDSENPDEPTPDAPKNMKFRIQWDEGQTGGVSPRIDGNQLIFEAGEIKWYEADDSLGRTEGNRVGAVITPVADEDVNLITKIEIDPGYEGSTPTTYEGENARKLFSEYNYLHNPGLYYYPLVKEVGQTAKVTITYELEGKAYEEIYCIEISTNCTLATAA